MRARSGTRHAAFSLVELVVVIVIIGIIAAMAVPRLSRGTAGARDSTLAGDLAILRNAIELYFVEHNNVYPDASVVDQLTKYTSLTGTKSGTTRDPNTPYGPYLKAIPSCPVGDQTDPTAVATTATLSDPVSDVGGWLYCTGTGEIIPNTNTKDHFGNFYYDY
jgi:prepilin-type N-terminal cleavage/methylation domain-containing protein